MSVELAQAEANREHRSVSRGSSSSSSSKSSNSYVYEKVESSKLEDGLERDALLAALPKSEIWKVKFVTFLNGIDSLIVYNSIINVANPVHDTLFPDKVWTAYWNAANTAAAILITIFCAYSFNPISLKVMKISSLGLAIGMFCMPAVMDPFVIYEEGVEYSSSQTGTCLALMCIGIFLFGCFGIFIQNNSYGISSLFCPKGSITKYEVIGEGISGVVAWLTMLLVQAFPSDRRGVMNGVWTEFALSAIFPICHFFVFCWVFRKGSLATEYVNKVNRWGFTIKDPAGTAKAPRAERSSFMYTLKDARIELIFLGLVMSGTLSVFPTFLPYGLGFTYNQNSVLMGIFILMDMTLRFFGHWIEKVKMPFFVFVIAVLFRIAWLCVTTMIPVSYSGVPGIGEFWFGCVNMVFIVITHTILFTYNILLVVRATKEKNQPQMGSVICLTVQIGLLAAEVFQMLLGLIPQKVWT